MPAPIQPRFPEARAWAWTTGGALALLAWRHARAEDHPPGAARPERAECERPTDGPETARLTVIGERQAQAIAASFDAAPELIVVSSFRRARETAAATHARFPGARLEVWSVEEFHY